MIVERIYPWAVECMRRDLVRRGVLSKLAELGGERFHYYELAGRGEGPPMVLVHGLGASADIWTRCLFRLAQRSRRVIVPDLPGNGLSPTPRAGPLGLEGLMGAMEAFVDQEVREPAVFVGNSLGGGMVARYAARHPAKVLAAVLIAPAGAPAAPDRQRELVRSMRVTNQAEALEMVRRVFHRPPPLVSGLIATALRAGYSTDVVGRLLDDALVSGSLAPGELQGLAMPVLLLWCGSERVLPYEGIDFFRAHLPGTADIREVRGFGHSPQLDRPRLLCRLVGDFVAERVAQGAPQRQEQPERAA